MQNKKRLATLLFPLALLACTAPAEESLGPDAGTADSGTEATFPLTVTTLYESKVVVQVNDEPCEEFPCIVDVKQNDSVNIQITPDPDASLVQSELFSQGPTIVSQEFEQTYEMNQPLGLQVTIVQGGKHISQKRLPSRRIRWIGDDGEMLSASNGLTRINKHGQETWNVPMGNWQNISVVNDRVFVSGRSHLTALNYTTGQKLWDVELPPDRSDAREAHIYAQKANEERVCASGFFQNTGIFLGDVHLPRPEHPNDLEVTASSFAMCFKHTGELEFLKEVRPDNWSGYSASTRLAIHPTTGAVFTSVSGRLMEVSRDVTADHGRFEFPHELAFDSTGSLYLTGRVSRDSPLLATYPQNSGFIAKLTPSYDGYEWINSIGGTGALSFGLVVDLHDRIFASFVQDGPYSIDGEPLPYFPQTEPIGIISTDVNGNVRWARGAGCGHSELPYATLSLDSSQKLHTLVGCRNGWITSEGSIKGDFDNETYLWSLQR